MPAVLSSRVYSRFPVLQIANDKLQMTNGEDSKDATFPKDPMHEKSGCSLQAFKNNRQIRPLWMPVSQSNDQ